MHTTTALVAAHAPSVAAPHFSVSAFDRFGIEKRSTPPVNRHKQIAAAGFPLVRRFKDRLDHEGENISKCADCVRHLFFRNVSGGTIVLRSKANVGANTSARAARS
jgi:hypothetical protein